MHQETPEQEGKVFMPQRSQGWLLHQMPSLLLKPGRESCLSAPQPVVLQLPSPSCPQLHRELLFPNRPVPYLLCAPAPGCSMGGFVQRNGSDNAGERRGESGVRCCASVRGGAGAGAVWWHQGERSPCSLCWGCSQGHGCTVGAGGCWSHSSSRGHLNAFLMDQALPGH